MSRSTNHQSSVGDPEVWFRIVHMAIDSQNIGYQKQTIEIGLGPKRAFENRNIDPLTRQVSPDGIVSAVPPRRNKPKRPKQLKTPRVVKLLRKAIEWQTLLESGQVESQAEIARQQGITRARVTQVMGMLRLAPEIQSYILSLPDTVGRPAITERTLRPVARLDAPEDQLTAFSGRFGVRL